MILRLVVRTAFLLLGDCVGIAARSENVPRTIYSFWKGPHPEMVQKCVESWRRFAKGWDIQVLDQQSARALLGDAVFPKSVDRFSLQFLSDIVRLEVVAAYGGRPRPNQASSTILGMF